MNFSDLLGDLDHPPTRHAMFVHLPIVLAMLGLPLTLLSALMPRNHTLRWTAVGLFALLAIASFVTVNSGDHAEAALGAVNAQANEILHDHERKAVLLWLFAAAGLILMVISVIKKPVIRMSAAWLGVIASALAILWVGQVAHLGGTLVYGHGLGTPNPVLSVNGASRGDSPTTAAGAETSPHFSESQIAFFHESVWPILSENCIKCHNPARAAAGKSGKLDQTSREALVRGGRSGPAVIIGKPEESPLIKRVTAEDEDERMPPPPAALLSEAQIAALEEWIRNGAAWGEVWVGVGSGKR